MLWPTSLSGGKVILLSDPGNFNAAYIRRSLEFCGVPILAAAFDGNGSLADLSQEDMEAVIGCLGIDLPPEIVKLFGDQYPGVPLLCVGNYFGMPVPDVAGLMRAPFASYQVIDRLIGLVRQQPDERDREP